MVRTRSVSAVVAAGVIAAAMSTGTAWAGGPGGVVEGPDDVYSAVGTGIFDGALAGFSAYGATRDEATARVIAECERAGGQECTADEVTSDALCIVAVADDDTDVVAGGAGVTVAEARADALHRAAANGTPLGPSATEVISDCP